MWAAIAKVLVQAAIWAAGHPDEVVKIVSAVKAAKGAK